MVAAFSAAGMRPCSRPTAMAAQGLGQRGMGGDGVFAGPAPRTPRSAGTPNRPGGRWSSSSLHPRHHVVSRRLSVKTLVTMGVRPGRQLVDGADVQVGVSKLIARVRGMGVAVIISRCGSSAGAPASAAGPSLAQAPAAGPRRSGAVRPPPPGPGDAKWMPCWMTACVPTTSRASPLATAAWACCRALALLAAGQPGHAAGPAAPATAAACRSAAAARISVGAISTHIASPPPSPRVAAMAATTVLPAPTSPCSSRCIGCSRRQVGGNFGHHPLLRAAVRPKGSSASRRCGSGGSTVWPPPGAEGTTSCGARSRARSRRACHCDSCCASSSSNFRRCQAGWLRSSSAATKGTEAGGVVQAELQRLAQGRQARPARTPGGSSSCRSARCRPLATALRK